MAVAKALPADLIDSLLSGYKNPEDLIGENGLLKQLTKALVERALDAEMEAHLGHAKNDTVTNSSGNTRNGKSSKKLKGEFGELPIEIPRDRNGSFEPQLIPKHQTHRSGFDDKILSLYARGMTVFLGTEGLYQLFQHLVAQFLHRQVEAANNRVRI